MRAGDAADVGFNTGSGRSPGVGNGNPLQYSYLENPTVRGAWGPKSLWMVTAAMKLKDVCSLEGNL